MTLGTPPGHLTDGAISHTGASTINNGSVGEVIFTSIMKSRWKLKRICPVSETILYIVMLTSQL